MAPNSFPSIASRFLAKLALTAALLGTSNQVLSHHTYAMFDPSRHESINGTVAKFEWKNPHSYIWVYVPSKDNPAKYDLWAFENGAPSILIKQGWSKDSLPPNAKVTVEYSPLRDGKPGGHCLKISFADGHSLPCQGLGNGPPLGATP